MSDHYDQLMRTGPGTPMGELMRQYWIPAALSSELKADGAPVRMMLLGEKLIAFRDSSGRVGIMDHRCPHRCASLFFGRNEEDGIRCVYHGWKYDVDGNCLDMANVPGASGFQGQGPRQGLSHAPSATASSGCSWATARAGAAAAAVRGLPRCRRSRSQYRFVQRDCNWLQALEGDLDTSHVGFLHFGARPAVGRSRHREPQISSSTARPNIR